MGEEHTVDFKKLLSRDETDRLFNELKENGFDFSDFLDLHLYRGLFAVIRAYPSVQKDYLKWQVRERGLKRTHVGHVSQIAEIEENLFVEGKPVLIYGPPGTGKSTFVELSFPNCHLMHVNASDDRTPDRLADKLDGIGTNVSLDRKKMVVFLDEIDGIFKDSVEYLVKFIQKIKGRLMKDVHILFACNEIEKVGKKLRDECHLVPFPPLSEEEVAGILAYYHEQFEDELGDVEVADAAEIAKKCHGDVRLGIQMLLGGEGYSDETMNTGEFITQILCDPDRNNALGVAIKKIVDDTDISITTMLRYLEVNMYAFHRDGGDYFENLEWLSQCDSLTYKIDGEVLLSAMINGITASPNPVPIKYPKWKKKEKTSEDENDDE